MLGVGWTEMLVIGVVALIVIGPRELPALMQKLGRFAGTVRRMGSDFQRELNKTTGLDEIKNLRTAITQPLKETSDAIRREFNTVSPSGKVEPSGAIKPADPKAESVVAEIHKAAGLPEAAEPVKTGPVKAATKPKYQPAPSAPVATAELPAPDAGATPAPAKPKPARAPRKVKSVDSPAPVEAIAPAEEKPKRPRKAAAKKSTDG
jgi:sec-independent protein translocase protein TatB